MKNFSMMLKHGEIASLVGESGSGKTTVIRAVLGLLAGGGKVTEGDIICEPLLNFGRIKASEKDAAARKFKDAQIMMFKDYLDNCELTESYSYEDCLARRSS